MAKARVVNSQKCPACHDDLKEPKILACAHLTCRQCLVSRLESNMRHCPICRRQILSGKDEDRTDDKALVADLPTDITTEKDDKIVVADEELTDDTTVKPKKAIGILIDQLPTDHVTVLELKIQSQKILNGPNVCNVCDGDSAAESFCLQCDTKLCTSCAKVHSRLPSTSDHTVEVLTSLTVEQLAAKRPFPCSQHKDKTAELYCCCHEELVCFVCAGSAHRKCDAVEEIASSAETKRKELEEQSQRLREKEKCLSIQIEIVDKEVKEAKAKFTEMQDKVINTFADLIGALEDQKHTLLEKIRSKEDLFIEKKLSKRTKLETLRCEVTTHADSVDTMVSTAPGKALLATLNKLKARLNNLESKEAVTGGEDKTVIGDVYFDDKILDDMKKAIRSTGELRELRPPAIIQSSCNPWLLGQGERSARARPREHDDGKGFLEHTKRGRVETYLMEAFQFYERKGDIFQCEPTDAMAHCVSSDFEMKEGIAFQFKQRFGGVGELRAQNKDVGDMAVLERDESYIYYLITKPRYFMKPTYESLRSSLMAMKKHIVEHGVKNLSIPQIGCGRDQLDWAVVTQVIREIFGDTEIKITVWIYDGKRKS